MKTTTAFSRRDFLRTGGAIVVSFAFSEALPNIGSAQTSVSATAQAAKPLDPTLVDSFLAFHADGSVTVFTSKVDVGTGLRIAMSQMTAEELGIPLERISIVEGDTAITPDQGGTGGSTGIPRGAVEVRQAAATARQALLNLAAAQLKRPAAELVLADGQVRPAAGGNGIALGSLIGGKRLDVKVDPKAPLKTPAQYSIVGKPVLRPDVPGKCTGRHVYLHDFIVPNMLHGRVIHPPAIGAKLVSVDESSIRNIPGVRLVRIESFLGVVASDEWAAVRAARELKTTWTEWQGLPGSQGLYDYVRSGPLERDETLINRGDAPATLTAGKEVSALYTWPYQSHASLGPACAVADVRPGGATIWTSSQGPHGMRTSFGRLFGLPEDKVRVIYMDGSGSYGTNGGDDAAAEAFLLSRAVGQPVRLQWSREDETGIDPKGPPQILAVRGTLDGDKKIAAWQTEMWLPVNIQGSRPLVSLDSAGINQPHGRGAGQTAANGDPPYVIPNLRTVVHWMKDSPLRLSNLRAPGKIANVFAVEGLTDELAAQAGMDPVEFRLRMLTDTRAIDVIKKAAEMIGWQSRPSPNGQAAQGGLLIGRGIAYMRYKQMENYVAIAMEAAVNRQTGAISVRKITCAHDCGLVINPDGLRNQVEGCIVQTLSRTLHEETKFDKSRVTTVDWTSYPILKFTEAPALEVALIDRPNLPPYGAGEAATAPVTAALANAIFDATGVRLRSVPFTTQRMKESLAAV